MHLELGPVPSASVRSWVGNARAVLAGVRRAGDHLPVELPDDVEAAFIGYLDEWDERAAAIEPFVWAADVDVDQTRHLVVYFFSLVSLDDATWVEHGLPFAPAEAEPFYLDLSRAVGDALAAADLEVGPSIRASWTEQSRRPPNDTSARLRRVVIIDDTADLRLLLTMTLAIDGRFEVVGEADNGAEGVELCRETRPDAVLLDAMMPVMDGLAALPLIRAACPDARIVMLSANSAPDVVRAAKEAGADDFVVKGAPLEAAVQALLA